MVTGPVRPPVDSADLVGGVEFLRAGARPATALVVLFIELHRERFGVEPMCRVLAEHGVRIAPSTFYATRSRPPSARSERDARLVVEIRRAHGGVGRGLYGVRKVW